MMYWQKRLNRSLSDVPKIPVNKQGKFLPVRVESSSTNLNSNVGLSVILPNGVQIKGIDRQTVDLVKPLLAQL